LPILAGFFLFIALLNHPRAKHRAKEDAGKLGLIDQRVKDFADTSSDWYFEPNSELRFSFFSDNMNSLTGLDGDIFLGKTRQDIGVPEVDCAFRRIRTSIPMTSGR
jgi:PAS domain-containing protein